MPTTNPVPSQDPSDLLFNAGKLDEVVSGSNATYTDRLGVSRRTMAGIDAAADVVLGGLGYAPPVAYASGISLTLTTQTVEYSGEVYAPKLANLPFTTTTWATDSAKFRLIQGLAATDLSASGGAAMVGYMPAGTGAVTTTVQSKLREFVSVFDFMTAAQISDVQAGAASIDVTAAFTSAIAAAKNIYVPEGKYLVSTLSFLNKTGYVLEGASPTKTILKGTAASTTVLYVGGSTPGGLNTYNVFKNFTVDMSAMTTATGAAAGVQLINIWGCSFNNVNVLPVSVAQRAMFVGQHVYTTVFDNCDFGGLTGCIELAGYATDIFYSTTTLTFVGCSFAQCLMDYVTSITFMQPIAQGDSNKFQMNRVSGITIIGGDIEGSATYLAFGTDCKNVTSINNAFVGFTGTYSSGTVTGALLLDQTNSPYYIKNGNATATAVETNGVVNEIAEVATLTRKSLRNVNATSQQVDISIQNANGYTLVGQDAAGNSYLDARGTGKFTVQQSGTDRLGVTADSKLLVNTTTVTTVGSAGGASALPATPVGYLDVLVAGVARKIPFYNA